MSEKTIKTTVVVDDLTDEPVGNAGWELSGRRNGVTLHFKSLSNLVEAILDADVKGLPSSGFVRNELERQGIL